MVMWDPVPESNRYGIVREYLVHVTTAAPSLSADVFDTSGNLSKEIVGLQPYTNFSIRVAAKTVAFGNFSEPIFVMTGEAGKTPIYVFHRLKKNKANEKLLLNCTSTNLHRATLYEVLSVA